MTNIHFDRNNQLNTYNCKQIIIIIIITSRCTWDHVIVDKGIGSAF